MTKSIAAESSSATSSDIGTLPVGWSEETLSEVCEQIVDGTHFTPTYVDAGVPFFSVETLTTDDFQHTKFISRRDHEELARRCRLKRGDVLLTRIGSLGVTKLIDWDVDASIYVSLALLRPNKRVSSRYLYAYTQGNKFVADLEARSLLNASPKKINLGDIGRIPIPVPPPEEQDAIADAVLDTQAAVAALRRLVGKKRAAKQAASHLLLTGTARLQGFDGPWTEFQLGEVTRIKTGSKNNQDKVPDGAYPFFVRSASVERINSYSHDGEAILVPGEGGIGTIFHYINGKCDVHQRVYKISDFESSVCGRFVYYAMKSTFGPHAMRNSVKATVDSLRLPTFKRYSFRAPADVHEQASIASALADMDHEIEALRREVTKLVGLKQGIMQSVLSGRVRVGMESAQR